MIIRKIRQDDNPAVADIIRQVMTEHGAVGEGYSIEDPEVDAMHQAYASRDAIFYVLEVDGTVVGCGGLGPLKGGEPGVCELKKMYFLPQARGQGAGKLLCEMLLVDAARLGYTKMYVETLASMQPANRLYAKLGFEPLEGPLGKTGHGGCDAYYQRAIDPPDIDPSLLA
ncbi:MAG: GNAT family N-acetyltransferase [Planctomycetota bacterium]